MPMQLPTSPREDTYEDLIAACLTGLGFFLESNLHLREDTREVLELDVVATPVVAPLQDTILLDAKSGKTGIGDIFKIFGWRTYLDIPKACIVRPTKPDEANLAAIRKLSIDTSVHVATVNLDDFDLTSFPSQSISIPEATRDKLIATAWYGRMGKRLCIKEFTPFTKRKELSCSETARNYRWAVEQSFFAPRSLDRAKAVYDASKSSAGITGIVIDEIADGATQEEKSASIEALWDEVRDTPKHKHLQFCLMLEHTARLRIVKNAMLHLLEAESSGTNQDDALDNLFRGWSMPASFQRGMRALQKHPHRNRIPYLWQLFIEVFGGFYCTSSNCDLEKLAECTLIPEGQIAECIELYSLFFPNHNGWFMTPKNQMVMMKNVPAIYHGTGAFLRQSFFGEKEYAKHIPEMSWLTNKWHKALHNALKPELS